MNLIIKNKKETTPTDVFVISLYSNN